MSYGSRQKWEKILPLMGALTPIWGSGYDSTGLKLISIQPDGTMETKEDSY